ncbi:MAG TPA: hypothetical protein VN493_01755 [Thermoanaerobaculia bacterium]|nr:hypothetical protein [Thermoanaerobaculia bacterium]
MAINRSDLDSLTSKLEKFAQELPEQEHNVLNWILARAKESGSELIDEDLDAAGGGDFIVAWIR